MAVAGGGAVIDVWDTTTENMGEVIWAAEYTDPLNSPDKSRDQTQLD